MTSPINAEITAPIVRVEVRHGRRLGLMFTTKALAAARRRGLDLVLQGPKANPPFCEIMDVSRYIYNDELALQFASASPVPLEPISGIPIPQASKSFLADSGLPKQFFGYQVDYDPRGLLRLDQHLESRRRSEAEAFAITCRRLEREPSMQRYFVAANPVDLTRYYRLGEMDRGNILSVERDTGNILAIDIAGFEGYRLPTFINSDVILLAQFYKLLGEAAVEDGEIVRSQFTALDAKAMEDPDYFWPLVVEEFEEGL